MFLGSFCADNTSLMPTCTNINSITTIEITNGIYDELFGSTNTNLYETDNLVWDFDTQFYAKFQNNLFAGNVDYTSDIVSTMRIKRRKDGEHTWLVLKDIEINDDDDFAFEHIDRYAQGDTIYDYAIIPVMSGIEGNINKNSIRSEFSNYFILDKDVTYPIIANTSLALQLNKSIGVVTTLGKKYPFIISNGLSQYVTGSFTFSLLKYDCTYNPYFEYDHNYVHQFNEWIMNGKSKILKDWTGKIYMINVTNSVPIDCSYYRMPTYEVQFTEIGDALNQDYLYYNGFVDYNYSLQQ